MKVLAFIRRHAMVVWLATGFLVLLGVRSAYTMPSGIYPEVEFPRIVVVARTGGAPPDVFLTNVVRPLEQRLSVVLGLQRLRSKTIRGATELSLQFAPNTDMWRALQMVESRVAEIRPELPSDTEIMVERVTTGSFPVVTFNVAGAVDPRELREFAEFVVRPSLANVVGVGRIEVLGGDVREVEVVLRPEATSALHLTPSDIADKLKTATGLSAVGRVDRDRQLVTVVADAQPKTIGEIAEIPIATTTSGGVIVLGNIAEVVDGAEDRLVRIGGPLGETVVISVARLPGASTTDVVDSAIAATRALAPSLPQGVTIRPVYDQASLVRESMASVRDAILIGVALCAAVISIFLRDLRAGLIAALTIPITLAISFAAMKIAHQTLNLMSLGGMAVAIGLVVDDAIVVVEAIARHRDRGSDAATAAREGARELAPAIIGTTLTTVVVFVPLAFLEGIVGDFFRALAFTLTAAVCISLAVALGLVPLAAGFTFSPSRSLPSTRAEAIYDKMVRAFMRHPLAAALALVAILASTFLIVPYIGTGFLPPMDEGAFVLDYFLPAGTSLTTTEQMARRLENVLKETPEVLTFSRRTGAELGPAAATQLNRGDIMVRLKPRGERPRSGESVIADLRERFAEQTPEVRIEFVQVLQDVLNDLSGSPRPIEVKLFGPDYAKLHEIGASLAAKLKGVAGLVDLYDGHERDTPELRFTPRRDTLARFGTTPDDASNQLQTALLGTRVGTIRRYDRLVGIRVRYPNPYRFDTERVLDLPFTAGEHATTFAAVMAPTTDVTASLLMHEALQPMVDVTADHEQRDLGSVVADVEAIVQKQPMPPAYRAVIGGQIEGQRATVRDLVTVAAVAVLLVLVVLSGQFHRIRLAALVIGTIPTAIVGALVALVTTRTPLNASSLMGCVLLVGLVVKNGVLLLEEAERLFDSGATGIEAVARASERRLRPIVMTTVATIAGLAPLALGIGAGAELQRPLAIAVIGGLLTSTVATLGFLPPFAALALRGRVGADHTAGRA
ncbi:MAG TPA: efflux RND transporter permease subunit [Polyangiaceae bacterium]|nr:efflux RND transporter permease subunit [Polyangiaceae bacterium]